MIYICHKTRCLNVEVNRNEPFPSASVPWLRSSQTRPKQFYDIVLRQGSSIVEGEGDTKLLR